MSEPDPGYGPPPGKPTAPARVANGEVSLAELSRAWMRGQYDSAFKGEITIDKAQAKTVIRDNPLVTIQNSWTIDQIRSALYAHITGQFWASAQLWDSMLGDDRISSTLNSRAAGWLGREMRTRPANDSFKARKCHEAWVECLPGLTEDSSIRQMADYSIGMGFAHGQLFWPSSSKLAYTPTIQPWHPIYEYYDWDQRCYIAIGQDAAIPIRPGNGKWIECAPFGSYRGWIRGAIRPCAEPWTLRHFGFRDMARFGEVHGNPTRIGYVPMVGDPVERAAFETALTNIGADAAMMIPRGVDLNDGLGYDYKLVEATSQAWQVHPAQIDRCDMAIVLALLMVNMTTSVEGGGSASNGAAKSMMDTKSQGSQLDNVTWRRTIYRDVARPFAFLNFGDADLAPHTWWDVKGQNEYSENARQFQAVGTAIDTLRRSGMRFSDPEQLRTWLGENFGLSDFPKFDIVAPVVAAGGVGLGVEPPDIATLITVNEARHSIGLGPVDGGDATVAANKTKNSDDIAGGTAAILGNSSPTDPAAQAKAKADADKAKAAAAPAAGKNGAPPGKAPAPKGPSK